ncbi:hypothetical protein N2W54_004449 [Lotmaria passim]
MFAASLTCLRSAAVRAARLPSLRQRLRHLRHTNRLAEGQLQERRRLHKLLRDTRANASTSNGGSSGSDEATASAIRLLPRNDALEAAMALSISENRDARTELELVRRLINSTLLSFASPVDRRWDPYDVKPQVFALNTYIALPVFTSIHYLRLFCQRFGFAVRDPSGVLWAAGAAADDERIAGLLPDAVVQSEWWQHRHAQQVGTTEVEMDDAEKGNAGAAKIDSTSLRSELRASVLSPDTSSSGASVAEASPASADTASASVADQGEPLMDASSLFDAMVMEGVVDEVVDTSTATMGQKRTKKKKAAKATRARERKRGKARVSVSTAATSTVHRRSRQSGSGAALKGKHCPSSTPHSRKVGSSAWDAYAAHDKKEKEKREKEDAARSAYWQAVAQTAPFELKQATPLPTFGPFLHPFLVGYFADIATLLHNAAIVPEKVDIVVNPGSPIEFVLARAATDRVLHKEQLLHLAYLRVEKELQREFSSFFAQYCPEVLHASSACVPLPMNTDEVASVRRAARTAGGANSQNPLQEYREQTRLLREAEFRNGVAYELTILIESTSLEETFTKIQHAKRQSMLMGHADLDVLPLSAAAPHVREVAQLFYDGASEQEKRATQQATASAASRGGGEEDSETRGNTFCTYERDSVSAAPGGTAKMGVFVRRGTPRTINVAQSADSYYHDPTNAYTEAHAVFTEELKVKRGQ